MTECQPILAGSFPLRIHTFIMFTLFSLVYIVSNDSIHSMVWHDMYWKLIQIYIPKERFMCDPTMYLVYALHRNEYWMQTKCVKNLLKFLSFRAFASIQNGCLQLNSENVFQMTESQTNRKEKIIWNNIVISGEPFSLRNETKMYICVGRRASVYECLCIASIGLEQMR